MRTVKLDDISRLITRGIAPKYSEANGVRVLNQKCVREHALLFDFSRIHDISTKPIKEDRFVKDGDILINSTGHGTLGRTALAEDIDQPTLVDSHITILRPKPGLFEPRYFAYLISQCEEDFVGISTGTSGQTELPRAALKEFLVEYEEDIEEQRRIVARLDAAFEKIDRAIELTEENYNRAIRLSEAMIEDTFLHHAGDHKVIIDDVCEIKGGKRLPKGKKLIRQKTKNAYIRVSDFDHKGGVDTSDIHYLTDDIQKEIARYIITTNDVFLSIAGTIGITGIVPESLNGANLTENACRLIPNNKLSTDYLYYFTLTKSFIDQAKGATRTTAQPKLALTRIKQIELNLPDLDMQSRIVAQLKSITMQTEKLSHSYRNKITHLKALKQSMLTQAFSQDEVN